MIYRENPAKIPVWQKIRQSIPQLTKFNRATAGGTVNLHFSLAGLNNEKSLHTLLLQVSPSPVSPSLISPSRNPPSRLLGQFDIKTKRIAERFATNCDTQTDKVPRVNI